MTGREILVPEPCEKCNLTDVILNIIIFISLSSIFYTAIRSQQGSSKKIVVFVFMMGAVSTLIIESLRFLSLTRFSWMANAFSNTFGTGLGIKVDNTHTSKLKIGFEQVKESIGRDQGEHSFGR